MRLHYQLSLGRSRRVSREAADVRVTAGPPRGHECQALAKCFPCTISLHASNTTVLADSSAKAENGSVISPGHACTKSANRESRSGLPGGKVPGPHHRARGVPGDTRAAYARVGSALCLPHPAAARPGTPAVPQPRGPSSLGAHSRRPPKRGVRGRGRRSVSRGNGGKPLSSGGGGYWRRSEKGFS